MTAQNWAAAKELIITIIQIPYTIYNLLVYAYTCRLIMLSLN